MDLGQRENTERSPSMDTGNNHHCDHQTPHGNSYFHIFLKCCLDYYTWFRHSFFSRSLEFWIKTHWYRSVFLKFFSLLPFFPKEPFLDSFSVVTRPQWKFNTIDILYMAMYCMYICVLHVKWANSSPNSLPSWENIVAGENAQCGGKRGRHVDCLFDVLSTNPLPLPTTVTSPPTPSPLLSPFSLFSMWPHTS